MNKLKKPRVWGVVPPEVPVIRDLNVLAPKFRAAVEKVVADMTAEGFDPWIFETIRTSERQRHIYGFGREYDDGRGIVSGASDVHKSWHGFGLAVDIVSKSKLWSAPKTFWDALGRHCAANNLRWGGDWDMDGDQRDENFRDFPHVQWGKPMRLNPSPRAAQLVEQGGLPAVWTAVGAM